MSDLIWIQTVDTIIVFLKQFFEKVDFDDKKNMQNFPVDKEVSIIAKKVVIDNLYACKS